MAFCSTMVGQTDRDEIEDLRSASNQALQKYDHEKVLSYLTDDVLITTGAGRLLSGKEALRKYIEEDGESRMFWIRTPIAIDIHQERKLAWETGTWSGFDPRVGSSEVVGGNYSAMWTKASGVWKIKSQLFVTLRN